MGEARSSAAYSDELSARRKFGYVGAMSTEPTAASSPRNPIQVMAAGALVLLLGAGYFAWKGDSESENHDTATSTRSQSATPTASQVSSTTADLSASTPSGTSEEESALARQLSVATALQPAIVAARDYLVRNHDAQGRFIYELDADGKPNRSREYNVLRHSGALYALGMLTQVDLLSADAKSTLALGAKYVTQNYLGIPKAAPETIAVFSKYEEEGGDPRDGKLAKLGGTALALVGLITARRVDESIVDLDTLQKLAGFLAFMQREDGGFHSKYSDGKGTDYSFESLYYPGEAMLALVMMYHLDHDARWLKVAADAGAYLVESRRGQTSLPADHWLLIATSQLLPVYGEVKQPKVSADELYAHVKAIADEILTKQIDSNDADAPRGAFTRDGRCTPGSTRVEGLLALEQLARVRLDSQYAEKLAQPLREAGDFLLRCQTIESGIRNGGVVTARLQGPAQERSEERVRGRAQVRIDYVQHAMSAYIGLARWCAEIGPC